METVIVDILAGINPLLGVIAALGAVMVMYLAKRNTQLENDLKAARDAYTSDLKENIENMVTINHTIRTLIEKSDVKNVEHKVDTLVNLINIVNHTLNSLEQRLNSTHRNDK